MKIDKEKINKVIYKNKDGNILKIGNGLDDEPEGAKYKTYFDATFTEKEYVLQKEGECEHKNVSTIIKPNGVIKQECENCKALRELDNNNGWSEWRMPFSRLIVESHSTWNEELAMAMANSGEYTLREAIYILGKSCERCINVLYKKYLPDKNDGYEEFSDEWKRAGTICEFCKHLGLSHDNYLKNKRKRIENIIKEEREKYDTDEFFLANVIEKLNEELRREGRENLSFVFMQQVGNKYQFGIQFKNKEVEILLNRFFNLNEILLFDDYLFKISGYNREKYMEESERIVYYDESLMENPEWFYIDSMNPVPKEKNGISNEEICKGIIKELQNTINENKFIFYSSENETNEEYLNRITKFINEYLKSKGFKYIDTNDSRLIHEKSIEVKFTFRKDGYEIILSNVLGIDDIAVFNEEKFIELNYNILEYIEKYCADHVYEDKRIEVNDLSILFGSINKLSNELKYKVDNDSVEKDILLQKSNDDSIEDDCITEK